jgi:hypothetical protein
MLGVSKGGGTNVAGVEFMEKRHGKLGLMGHSGNCGLYSG